MHKPAHSEGRGISLSLKNDATNQGSVANRFRSNNSVPRMNLFGHTFDYESVFRAPP